MRTTSLALAAGMTATGLALSVSGGALAGAKHHALVTEVHVTFTDTTLVVSPTSPVQPGAATFFLVNRGKKVHQLTIKGPGMVVARAQKVVPGGSMILSVKLLAGAYKLSDPAGLRQSNIRWLVVRPSTLGPSKALTPPKTAPTTAVSSAGGMDCAL